MVDIVFHSHATTFDNEAGKASGHNDVELSPQGQKEAQALGKRYAHDNIAVVFCSDLQRAAQTAKIAFGDRFPIIADARLRECDYGQYTGRSKAFMLGERPRHVTKPFPDGESYTQVVSRMKTFLNDLLAEYNSEKVMIIGHGGTRVALEYWLKGVSLEAALKNVEKSGNSISYQLDQLYPLRIDSQPLD